MYLWETPFNDVLYYFASGYWLARQLLAILPGKDENGRKYNSCDFELDDDEEIVIYHNEFAGMYQIQKHTNSLFSEQSNIYQ